VGVLSISELFFASSSFKLFWYAIFLSSDAVLSQYLSASSAYFLLNINGGVLITIA